MRRTMMSALLAVITIAMLAATCWAKSPEPTEPDPQQIDRLIQKLGDKDYYVREGAQAELAKIGLDAFDALTAATNNDDVEIAARAKILAAVDLYEHGRRNGSPGGQGVAAELWGDVPSAATRQDPPLGGAAQTSGAAALCRLVRFENE